MIEIIGQYSSDDELADTHIHSDVSDGLLTPEEVVEKVVAEGKLSTIAITDHETIEGARRAREYSLKKGYPLKVVIGAEISAQSGIFPRLPFHSTHIIGLGLRKDIPSGRPVNWTIKEIHRQGALAIAPHPLYMYTGSPGARALLRVIYHDDPDIFFDGFETFNASVHDMSPHTNKRACAFYLKHQEELGAAIGATDAHFDTIGRGMTTYRGDLLEAIKESRTSVVFSEERDKFSLKQLALQQAKSLYREPRRRIERYMRRRLIYGQA